MSFYLLSYFTENHYNYLPGMRNMDLRQALGVLSKSSPYAVATERDYSLNTIRDDIKKYLYIEMPIEKEVKMTISGILQGQRRVVFLCGSSGDGKSEILTACKKIFSSRVKFHLDATHSFKPNEDAIQTLDKVFQEFEETAVPLVVGINTGMLGNYAEEGNNEFFKKCIQAYLDEGIQSDVVHFINFEDYPKFKIDEVSYTAEFAERVLERLTVKEENIVRQLYDKDKLENFDEDSRRLHTNYELLSIPIVQRTIVDLLFKARLMRDQFLTARSLLDFIFILLTGPGYLFENLFSGSDNELANKIIEFDPAHLRTKKIDRFILVNDLALPDDQFQVFKDSLKTLGIVNLTNSYSYLRLFYVLKSGDFANNFHLNFSEDFNETLIEKYIKIYQLHRDYEDTPEKKKLIKDFYNNTLRTSIRKYNNRNAPKLDKNHYLISELNGYQMVAKLDVKLDSKAIPNFPPKSSSSFTACIKVDDVPLTVPVNINLLNLMQKIVDGYRPNKHDKNTVVLLDELIEELSQVANRVTTLHIVKGDQHFTVKNADEDEFEVSGT
jgi:DNA phosphorothioation-dependent restriction protein DptF